jgi:hypothetical protein
METIFIPVNPMPIPDTGNFELVTGCAIDGSASPVPKTKFESALKSFAAGGRVQCNHEWGSISALKWGIYELDLPKNAQTLVQNNCTRFLALKLDHYRGVVDAWLADRPTSEITHLERMQKMQRGSGSTTFTKSAWTAPQENPMDLESALKKVYDEPQSVRAGFFRKDIATTRMPQSHSDAEEESNLKPPARTPSRTPTAPSGTIDVAELARANDELKILGEHLQAAQRANPSSRQISDAGMAWYAVSSLGLGIDSAFMGGAQTVAVTPNNEALAEAWAHSTGDKAAGGCLDFRKALTKQRQAPNVLQRNGGQVSSRPVFSKAAADDDGQDEARRVLHTSAIHTARAHLKALDDKLTLALQAHGGSPELTAARTALGRAREHLENCMETNPDKR